MGTGFLVLFVAVMFAYGTGKFVESYSRSVTNARRHRNAYWRSMKYSAINNVFVLGAILAVLVGIALGASSCECPTGQTKIVRTEPCFVAVYCISSDNVDAGPQQDGGQ